MVFSSTIFLCYFLPVFLLLYFLLPYRFKNYFILLASICFYAWGAPKFIFIVFGVLLIDYWLGNRIYKTEGRTKKYYLLASIALNIGMLFYYKYCNFFVENVNEALGLFGLQAISWTKIILPIGISFFVFQEMSYTIDIYRGEHAPLKKFSDYMLFIFLFSHLIAGPIVTYNVLADDIVERRKKINADYRLAGFFRLMVGLARKVIIANTLGEVANDVFGHANSNLSSTDCWIGAFAYTFQLYFDFAGYSDMAIGLGKLMGFDFPENFNNPYISQNITEFWQRWHITLGNWMKRYLYIPLGGNRVSENRMYVNLITVFLLSGLWHGASWTFVIWGAYHGFFLVCDRLFLNRLLGNWPKLFRVLLTFVIAVFGWVLFRADTLAHALTIMQKMLWLKNLSLDVQLSNFKIFILLLAPCICWLALLPNAEKVQQVFYRVTDNLVLNFPRAALTLLLFLLSITFLVSSSFNPFIYFRF
ncbi:MAG: MBOAT family O-acyltransferase [Chitinophagales bacterium]